jgi:putative redox protein
MTLRLYAERKGWELGEVTVDLSHERVHSKDIDDVEVETVGYMDVIRAHIAVTGPINEEQAERLHEIAGKCPMYKTLMGWPRIIEELEVVG